MSGKQNPLPESKFRIDFIDPLFAVAIHIGFVEGLMKESWLKQRFVPVVVIDYADLFMFVAALWFLALSWVGYHTSIAKKPILRDTRFILDIALLLVYILLFLYFRHPKGFSLLLLATFALYVWWDFEKTKEYSNQYYDHTMPNLLTYICTCFWGWLKGTPDEKLKGETVTVGWTVVFAIVVPFAFLPIVDASWGKLIFALVVIGAATRYRWDKTSVTVWIWSVSFKIVMGAAIAFVIVYKTRAWCF